MDCADAEALNRDGSDVSALISTKMVAPCDPLSIKVGSEHGLGRTASAEE